jgi:predicted metal-binding protein
MADTKQALEALFQELGYSDYRWIDPESIVVSQWVRMKCRFGCPDYGNTAVCPPQVPSIAECERFFREYTLAAVFHFAKAMERPEDRHEWTKGISEGLLELERRVFISGYRKAFLLYLDSCHLCGTCSGSEKPCFLPKQARPTPEALGVDVFATVRQIGYPIEVLSDYDQTMNRYAFLLIE